MLINVHAVYEKYISLVCCSESGNPFLLMNKSDCAWKNKMKVVLGITLSGILIIALAWIMGMVVYQKIFC